LPNEELIDAGARALKEQLLKNYSMTDKKTIGIASFARTDLIKPNAQYAAVIPQLGIMFANALQNEMFVPDRFDLVERMRIEALLKETNLYQTGFTNEESTLRTTQLSGVDYILLGTLQRRESTIRVDARLVSIVSGTVVSVGTTILPFNDYINRFYSDYPERSAIYRKALLATGGWQQINAPIRGPVSVEVSAEGNWSMTNDGFTFSAAGVATNPSKWGEYRITTGFNHGALLCRLNSESGTYFTIGVTRLEGNGIIECTINDRDQSNNAGALSVTIKVTPLD